MTTPAQTSVTTAAPATDEPPAVPPGLQYVPVDDGLALPIDYDAKYGAGKKRALVLGGGGIYFVAWQVAYINGLAKRGVDLGSADIIVGTSAGSLVASILANGSLKRFGKQVDWISRVPALVGLLAPAVDFHPSQLRALQMFREAADATPATVRDIGYAALAAHAPAAAEMRRSTGFAIAARGWPSSALHISTVDTYTGERLILTQSANLSAIRAAASSSAVPGVFSPQPIHDRWCMDGGVSGSGTHCDVVAGAERALVISLGASFKQTIPTMTVQPGRFQYELNELHRVGTKAFAKGPTKVDMTKLMDPDEVPEAIAIGDEQAAADAVELAAFWNS